MSAPTPSRRGLLAGVAALLATASAGLGGLCGPLTSRAQARSLPTARTPHWHKLGAEDLRAMIGERFALERDDGSRIALRLAAVEPVPSGPDRPASLGRAEGAIAVFEGGDSLVEAGHRTYRVAHARMGPTDLFLGPVRRAAGGYHLEAVFN